MTSPENSDLKLERRRGDTLLNLVSVLFAIILTGMTWWMNKINDKAERVPILEANMEYMQASITRIEKGVNDLVNRR